MNFLPASKMCNSSAIERHSEPADEQASSLSIPDPGKQHFIGGEDEF